MGASELTPNSALCGDLLNIYQVRLKHLQRYGTSHARKLREDVALLCRELAKSPEERVQTWTFEATPNIKFAVFEAVESRRVVGCILSVGKTRTGDGEWHALWHHGDD